MAHGAGNLRLHLHDDGPDFAVWCSYKYLNGGPGSLGGVFVHARHRDGHALPRFEGWWGHDKASRFEMPQDYVPLPGAEGWQLSNPPILQLAALRASMELFAAAGMGALVEKRERLTGYLAFLFGGPPERPGSPHDAGRRKAAGRAALGATGGRTPRRWCSGSAGKAWWWTFARRTFSGPHRCRCTTPSRTSGASRGR